MDFNAHDLVAHILDNPLSLRDEAMEQHMIHEVENALNIHDEPQMQNAIAWILDYIDELDLG